MTQQPHRVGYASKWSMIVNVIMVLLTTMTICHVNVNGELGLENQSDLVLGHRQLQKFHREVPHLDDDSHPINHQHNHQSLLTLCYMLSR
jgi:hypothetical protein